MMFDNTHAWKQGYAYGEDIMHPFPKYSHYFNEYNVGTPAYHDWNAGYDAACEEGWAKAYEKFEKVL